MSGTIADAIAAATAAATAAGNAATQAAALVTALNNGVAAVHSVAGKTGNVVLGVADVTGAASTAYVDTAVAGVSGGGGGGGAVASVAGKTGAVTLTVTDVANAASTSFVTTSISTAIAALPSAPVASVAGRTGAITLAVADVAGAASTSYVDTAVAGATGAVHSVAGRTGTVTLGVADVSGAAPLAGPSFTGGVQYAGGGFSTTGQTITADTTQFPSPAGTFMLLQGTWTGTNSTAQHELAPIYLSIADHLVDTATSGTVGGLTLRHTITTAAKGGRCGILSHQLIVGPTANTFGGGSMGQYSPATFIATSSTPDGGTVSGNPNTYWGGIFGGNSQTILNAGATGWLAIQGHEVDVALASGASAADKVGLRIVLTAPDNQRGDFVDAAININGQDGASGTWKDGILFGSPMHKSTFAADSTLITAAPRVYGGTTAFTALHGVDFTPVTFTAGGSAFRSPNFNLDGNSGIARQKGFTQPLIIGQSGTPHSTTSATAVNLDNVKVPGTALDANGALHITSLWGCTNSANTKTLQINVSATQGATTGANYTSINMTTSYGQQVETIIRAANSTAAQTGNGTGSTGFGVSAAALPTSTIDTTADFYINFNGGAAGGDTLTLLGYTVELVNP